jgi:EAL domain-containing protein (putative c-di-GMP-specific phosphodiesterase class I)
MYDSVEKENLVSPGKFLPFFKLEGKNRQLTSLVVDKVFKFMKTNPGNYSINLTEDDILDINFVSWVTFKAEESGIDPKRVTFEILEEIEKIESDNVMDNFALFKELGFSFAIDDF